MNLMNNTTFQDVEAANLANLINKQALSVARRQEAEELSKQNAMVRLFNQRAQQGPQGVPQGSPIYENPAQIQQAKDYGELMAIQEQATQYGNVYGPFLSNAYSAQNEDQIKAIGDIFEKSGNSIMQPFGEMLKTVKFLGRDEQEATYNMGNERQRGAAFAMLSPDIKRSMGIESPADMPTSGYWKGTIKGNIAKNNGIIHKFDMIKDPTTPDKTDKVTNDYGSDKATRNWLKTKTTDERVIKSIDSAPAGSTLKVQWDDKKQKVIGVDHQTPPKTTVNVKAGGEGGTNTPFTDDEFERFYNMGQKTEGLPQRVRGTARANQKAREQWDVGFRDWLKRRNISGAQAGTDASEQRGDIKAMEKLKIQKSAIGGFERGAKNAMQIAFDLNKQMKRGRFPGINKLSLLLKYHAGDPMVRPFENAVVTAMTEYMKVVTAGTNISSTELSVAAQERAKTLLEKSDNFETFKKQMEIFGKEMRGKMKGIEDQEKYLARSMNRGGGASGDKATFIKAAMSKGYSRSEAENYWNSKRGGK